MNESSLNYLHVLVGEHISKLYANFNEFELWGH